MASAHAVVIGISFRDRDGNQAKITCYSPWSFTVAALWTCAETLAERIQALSDAVLVKIELLWRFRPDTIPEAPESSNVERKLLLLIENENEEINGLIVPSVIVDIFEQSGVYAGIRADLDHPGFDAFMALLTTINFQTKDNRALGDTIAAGGLAI